MLIFFMLCVRCVYGVVKAKFHFRILHFFGANYPCDLSEVDDPILDFPKGTHHEK